MIDMVTATISEIYDLSTKVGSGTVLKVHTPTGNNVKRHLLGHFLQYKQFKYLGADVLLIPASTLPADPLQLGYEAGEPTIDPRDMVNPILYKYYHGEAMLTDSLLQTYPEAYGNDASRVGPELTGERLGHSITEQDYYNGGVESTADVIYPNCLMDPSFKKAGVQQGFRVRVKPYVYNLVSNRQYLSNQALGVASSTRAGDPSADGNVLDPLNDSEVANWMGLNHLGQPNKSYVARQPNEEGGTFSEQELTTEFVGELFTNKLQPLGWMDTVTNVWTNQTTNIGATAKFLLGPDNIANSAEGIGSGGSFSMQTYLPNVAMLYVMMPPAYKTLFYFRMIIKHHFAFRGFRSCFNIQSYGSASIRPDFPYSAVQPTSASYVAKLLSDMVEDTGSGGPDSVIVENGDLISSADGVTA